MDKLKVVFLTYAYPPQKFPRSVQIAHLVQYLQKDFIIDVITSVPQSKGDESLLDFTSLNNVIYAEKSKLTNIIERAKGNRIKKMFLPDFYYPWHFDLFKRTIQFLKGNKVDLIVTFGQPMSTHLVGVKIKKIFPDLKWIAHFSDPWINNSYNEYNIWKYFINKRHQNKVFKTTDKILFTSKETFEIVAKNYKNNIKNNIKNKIKVLPHCFNNDLYKAKDNHKSLFIVRYLGNFYGSRQPNVFLEALKIMQINNIFNKEIKIELVGVSDVGIDEKIKEYKLENLVSTKLSVDYLTSLRLMEDSDLLIVIEAPLELSPFLPSKLIDYIGSNKPIFGITPIGTSQKLIEEMGFLVANPTDSIDIATKLFKMIELIRSGQIKGIPEKIRNRYRVEEIGSQFSGLLKNLIEF